MSMVIEGKDFWQRHVEQLKISGLTRSQYCRDNDINYDRFGYWLKKLSLVSPEFIPVKLQQSEHPSPPATLCTIELSSYVLKIHELSALSFILERLA